jgi:hypothetical protein
MTKEPCPEPSICRGPAGASSRRPCARQGPQDHRLLRGRHPVGSRRACARATRLLGRGIDGRWVQQVEGRGTRLGHPEDPRRRSAQPLPTTPPSPRDRRGRPATAPWSRRSSCSVPAASAHPPRSISPRQEWGTIGIVDMDVVDASNLQRQVLHNLDRIGERKVDSAKKTLTALNPDVDVDHLRPAPRRGQRARDHRLL